MCQRTLGYLPGFHEVPRTLGYPSAFMHTQEYPELAQGTLGYPGVFGVLKLPLGSCKYCIKDEEMCS